MSKYAGTSKSDGGTVMNSLFDGPPAAVAERLVGKSLRVGRQQGIILKVLPQSQRDNAEWIDRRPLFGPDPVDAYVASYRSALMLFLRTDPANTCVRIDEVKTRDGVFSSPTQVCRALGITGEASGWVSFNGQTVQVRWL